MNNSEDLITSICVYRDNRNLGFDMNNDSITIDSEKITITMF